MFSCLSKRLFSVFFWFYGNFYLPKIPSLNYCNWSMPIPLTRKMLRRLSLMFISLPFLYLMVQSLNKHFLSVLPQDVHIIPTCLQIIKLFFEWLLLEVRFVLNPLGSAFHQLLKVWFAAVNLILSSTTSKQRYNINIFNPTRWRVA